MLPSGLSASALADAAAESDPESLAAAERLRRVYDPETAAAALDQIVLRRRAVGKFGAAAEAMFFTRDGLEQATRPTVARHHAARLLAAGVDRVVDLGCGIGSDALAFVEAGLRVVAVEIDPQTADIARANLAGRAEVVTGAAEEQGLQLIGDSDAVFIDPARRTTSGRLWRTQDFSPGWPFVRSLLDGSRPAGVKLGPALPHREIPAGVEAQWISDRGETVEVCLWAGTGSRPDSRVALITPDTELVGAPRTTPVQPPGRYLYEPDGAVIRAGAIGVLAEQLSAWLLDDQIAYLSSEELIMTPYATAFTITQILPYSEKVLRHWVRDHRIGTLEIKKRGIEVDPAALRKRLKPTGTGSATMIITRTPDGARVLIADRVLSPKTAS